jgi:hypothetical protein
VKSWEIIADNLDDAGWILGWSQHWILRAHDFDCRRASQWNVFVVRVDENLTGIWELEAATRAASS